MSLHTKHNQKFEVYFCTITCHDWLPLFEEAQAYEVVYKWFGYLIKNCCQITGYVIMPNHLHVLLYLTHIAKSLNQLVGEGKRFIAYEIVKGLKQHGKLYLLEKLKRDVRIKERVKGKKHQVFRLSFDARRCFNEKIIEQKLNYIHHNPVKGRWSLADDYVKYAHSSANYYENGIAGSIAITHYKELGKVEL